MPDLAAALVTEPAIYTVAGSRSAAPQWALDPVAGHRLSIGDAALAYSPLAGQGLRFAASSALAAASVIHTWLERGDRELASTYYRSLVLDARLKHVAALESIEAPEAAQAGPDARTHQRLTEAAALPAQTLVRFVASTELVPMSIDARVVQDRCCVLADGSHVRWLGRLDLLDLQAAVGAGRQVAEVILRLTTLGYTEHQVRSVLGWSLRAGVLAVDTAMGPS